MSSEKRIKVCESHPAGFSPKTGKVTKTHTLKFFDGCWLRGNSWLMVGKNAIPRQTVIVLLSQIPLVERELS